VWGPYLYFGFPLIESTSAQFIPWALLVGVVCGVGGGFFGKLLMNGAEKIRTLDRQTRYKYVAGAGLILAIWAFFTDGYVFGGGTEVVRMLLWGEEHQASWGLVVGRYAATLLTYLTGTAGGIFAPSLAVGAAIGDKIDSFASVGNGNLMTLIGMTAFLSAVTRAPFTSLVLVFEMTDRHSAIFLLMVGSVSAYAVSHLIDKRSFYEHVTAQYTANLMKSSVKETKPAPKPAPKPPPEPTKPPESTS